MNDKIHQPVLATATIDLLHPALGESYLDLTAGYGGHANLILDRIGPAGAAVLVDRDQNAIDHLNEKFGHDTRVEIMHDDYLHASQQLLESRHAFDCILADIGVSSPHLDNPDRGFSFMNNGPLDMRMDPRQKIAAKDVVNDKSEEELAYILHQYGEVQGSRHLSRLIIEHRPYATTQDLATVISTAIKGPKQPKVLAQVFQALRIVVNDELKQLEESLSLWIRLLKPGGRLAVISFHSLEDRIVKQYFTEHGGDRYDSEFVILTRQPIVGSAHEIVSNPRARSAKLRAVAKK